MSKTCYNYFKFIFISLGLLLIAISCEDEASLFESIDMVEVQEESNLEGIKVKNVSLKQLNHKQSLKNSITKISKEFDVNKEFSKGGLTSKIDVVTGGFTILTENILEVSTDSTTAYTFKIETPTDSSSTFENFVIDFPNDSIYHFYIYKYTYDNTIKGDFPYDVDFIEVDENIVDISVLSDLYSKETICGYTINMVEGVKIRCTCCNEEAIHITCESGYLSETANFPLVIYNGSCSGGSSTSTNTDSSNSSTCKDCSSNNTTQGDAGSDPNSPTVASISLEEQQYLNFVKGLEPESKSWLVHNDNINSQIHIYQYLSVNEFSFEAENFATLALDALINKDDVDYTLEIIIKKKLNDDYPCHANVISEAIGVCSPLTQIILDVFEANDQNNLVFYSADDIKMASLNSKGNATTFPVMTCNNNGGCNTSIYFRESYLESATDLAIAKTTIHEALHAVLVYMHESNLLESDNKEYFDLIDAYGLYLQTKPSGLGRTQHEIISSLVDDIASSLSTYGGSQGYNLSFDYYKDLSWGGLMGTQAFKTLYPKYLNPLDAVNNKDNINPAYLLINNLLASENTNSSFTYPHPNGNTYETEPKGTSPSQNSPCN